jgi:protein phosphatase 1 regulatory subunit 7
MKNNITKIEGLETLVSLEYLALNSNKITKVEGLQSLRNLQGVNLANNLI